MKEVEEALRSSHLTRGPRTKQFECHLADLVRRNHCVSFCNGTAAIYAAVMTRPFKHARLKQVVRHMNSRKGRSPMSEEDIRKMSIGISDVTFLSVRSAVETAGYGSYCLPIDRDTFCSDASSFGSPGLGDAVICDLGGYVPDGEIAIEDASHSLGGEAVGRNSGIVVGSLHAIKNLGIGEGGFAATDDKEQAESMRRTRDMGRGDEEDELNYHPNELSCALGLSRMSRLKEEGAEKRAIIEEYRERLDGFVSFQNWRGQEVNPHLCLVRSLPMPAPSTYLVERSFERSRIQFIKHYMPLSMRRVGGEIDDESQSYWDDCFTLPMWVGMKRGEIDTVVEAVKSADNIRAKSA